MPFAALAIVMTAAITVAQIHRDGRPRGPWTVAGRLLTGTDVMHGQYHWTNAGWFTKAADVKVLHRSGRAPKWQHKCLALRAGVRCGLVLLTVGVLVNPVLTVAAAVTAAAVMVAGWRFAVRGFRWHRRSRVQPMAQALATVTGTAPGAVRSGIRWGRGYALTEPGEFVASWVLPPGFKATPKERGQAEHLWQSRTGFELVFDWRTADERPLLVMTRARELPPLVPLESVLAKVEALPEHKTAIGVDDRGGLVCWDWGSESPHGLLNAGSRHGKTETEMAMVGQVLRKGGDVTYIDVKRVSIQGLKGLPGLTLFDNPRDMTGMWRAIEAWGDDLDTRIDARAADPTAEFRRSLLVIEEVNQFSEMCDQFWENWPEEDEQWRGTILWKPKRAKKKPPIWRVISKGVWEGAFAKKNVLVAGQNIEAATLKGIRNSIGMRLMGGYQPQNWKALVATTPIPAAPPQKGRWCLVNGSDQTWLQGIIADLTDYKSAAIWRDYARVGRRLDGTVPGTRSPVPPGDGGDVIGARPVIHGRRLVGLAEAVDEQIVTCSLAAARQARFRGGFPGSRGEAARGELLYDAAELRAWDVARSGERVT